MGKGGASTVAQTPAVPSAAVQADGKREAKPAWTKIHGKTLDVSKFRHPGGNIIELFYGMDATTAFEAFHGHHKGAFKMLRSPFPNLGAWLIDLVGETAADYLLKHCASVAYGGFFAAQKVEIERYPVELYKAIAAQQGLVVSQDKVDDEVRRPPGVARARAEWRWCSGVAM